MADVNLTIENTTFLNGFLQNVTSKKENAPASVLTIVLLSVFFIIVGFIGLVGNILVLVIVYTRKKMKNSMTNLIIANVAVADFIVLATGIPEMVQFVMNRGWTLGEPVCKVNRFLTVTALYVSIMSLVLVCIER